MAKILTCYDRPKPGGLCTRLFRKSMTGSLTIFGLKGEQISPIWLIYTLTFPTICATSKLETEMNEKFI